MYKVVLGLVAVPHEGHIERNYSKTRAKNPLRLKVYADKTETFRNSFFPKTIIDWNSLLIPKKQPQLLHWMYSKLK
jgi:hypothetical protein